MQGNNQTFTNRIIITAALFVAVVICLVVYGASGDAFAPINSAASYSPRLTDPQLLQDWFPVGVYKYVVSQIYDYLKTNGLQSTSMSVQGEVSINNNGAYAFSIYLLPQEVTHQITVTVSNSDALISTAVAIDGQQQSNFSPTQNNNSVQTGGLNDLVSDGITDLQAQELQSAFQKFTPNLDAVVISPSSIVLPVLDPDNPSLTSTYDFSVSINSKKYGAKLNVIGLNEVELFLSNPQTGEQVFDSGIINQNQ